MIKHLVVTPQGAVPITPLGAQGALKKWLASQPPRVAAWVRSTRFTATPGAVSLLAGADGRLERVLAGFGDGEEMWDWAALASRLPERTYRIDASLDETRAGRAALGWALASYRFDRYRKAPGGQASLVWPKECDRAAVERAARATFQVRDLINTPASDMGPAHLAAAARGLARRHGARVSVITGERLLSRNFPAIHAVGRASAEAPRLIDLRWGKARAPRVTLCGKGVCFDTGGLDLKSPSGMKLMKKDMGGAAHALGLADMIMGTALPVRLRVLIPAVENSVAGNALRPLDVVATRQGTSVEIGNTDAEGRVVLAAASAERPDLVRQANWQKVGGASPLERRSNRTTFLREPCVGSREGAGEASVAAWMGRAIEHRKSDGPGCRGFQIGRRQYRRRRFGEMSASPAVSENPCTFARLLSGPGEVFKLPLLS